MNHKSILLVLFLVVSASPGMTEEMTTSGLITTTSAQDFSTTVQRLEKAIRDHKLGIVSHINAQENLKKKGIVIGGNQIFEIFRPDLAKRVFDRNLPAGIEIPLRIYVYEDGSKTIVQYRLPSKIFQPYGDSRIDELGAELDEILRGIVSGATQ